MQPSQGEMERIFWRARRSWIEVGWILWIPPFAMKLRRMGHPEFVASGFRVVGLGKLSLLWDSSRGISVKSACGVGEVDDGLGGRVVAPGAYGVEVGEKFRRQLCGEGFAVELLGEGVGEVLEHGEADEDGVAGRPRGGLVAEDAEFDGEMRALGGDGGVDAAGVELEPVQLVGWEGSGGAVGGGTDLEGALGAVVRDEAGAEDFGEFAGGVAAEDVHLPEAVLRGDEALGEDEVVEGGGVDVRDAVGVALDGDGSGEAGDGEGAVDLREGVAHGLAGPVASADEGDSSEEEGEGDEDGDGSEEDATAARGESAFPESAVVGCVWGTAGEQRRFGGSWIVEIHALIQSLNGELAKGCRDDGSDCYARV